MFTKLKEKVSNCLLKFNYLYLKNSTKKLDVSNRKLDYNNDCKTLETFNVHDGEFYNDNDV